MLERGLVLYNHVYHSDVMRSEWLQQLVQDRAYLRSVNHRNYNPRLVEFITGLARPQELDHVEDDWVEFALNALDHPRAIWNRAFQHEIDELQRAILFTLVSIGRSMRIDDLRQGVEAYCSAAGIVFDDGAYQRSLRVLEITLLGFGQTHGVPSVDVVNPSVANYVLHLIGDDGRLCQQLLEGAQFFDQPEQFWDISRAAEASEIRDLLRTRVAEGGTSWPTPSYERLSRRYGRHW